MSPIQTKEKSKFNKKANHPVQSWEWGEFRKATGNEIVRLDFGQITLHKIPLLPYKIGVFVKCPKPTKKFFSTLKNLAKEHSLIFIRLEPSTPIVIRDIKNKNRIETNDKEKLLKVLKENNCVPGGKSLFKPSTFWIDLTPSEESLLKSFHHKARYNIKLAQRKKVKVSLDNSDKAFDKYIDLTRETMQRHGFYLHTEKYHRLMWKALHTDMIKTGNQPIARLLKAEYKGDTITTWILLVWQDFLYYPYGASSTKHKNVMANNLVMWEAIRYGKSLGLKTFNLWGREPGKGFNRFKESYNPKVVEFLGTWDLITSPLYYPYRLAESLRWPLLRLKSKFIKPEF
jgi:lipid II:glycine glycyltransferase (peptidoglycan interpeptide bridge formation enzyme)